MKQKFLILIIFITISSVSYSQFLGDDDLDVQYLNNLGLFKEVDSVSGVLVRFYDKYKAVDTTEFVTHNENIKDLSKDSLRQHFIDERLLYLYEQKQNIEDLSYELEAILTAAESFVFDVYNYSFTYQQLVQRMDHFDPSEFYYNPDADTIPSFEGNNRPRYADRIAKLKDKRTFGFRPSEQTQGMSNDKALSASELHTFTNSLSYLELEQKIVSKDKILPLTELKNLKIGELRFLIYTIFASCGKTFTNENLTDYFKKRAWYQPKISLAYKSFSRYDIGNLILIASYFPRVLKGL
jgi:hypothetical protein